MVSSSSACPSRIRTETLSAVNRTFATSDGDSRPRAAGRRPKYAERSLALALCGALTCFSAAFAQTAHSGGNIVTLGSGFNNPYGVAVDASGNVFVADFNANAVKEIVAASGYTTVLTLGSGFSGPTGVAVDSSGNVFVADSGNNQVKEIVAVGGVIPASSPTINTLGSGFAIPSGVAVDSSGNVFVADYGSNLVKEIIAIGGVIPASSPTINTLGSGFNGPSGVAVDSSGNVFVTDQNNGAVKEILAAGGYTTVQTLGSGFSAPFGVAVSAGGNVFVGDFNNTTVTELVAAGGYTTVLALGSGISSPAGVAVDASGNVFVADAGSSTVKKIVSSTANYGSASVATTTPVTLPLTFTFDTGGTILAPSVLTQGAPGLDFTDAGTGTCAAGTYSTGATCTVNVSFIPTAPGTRYGAATLKNSSGTVIATAYVSGTGTGPQVTFSPSVQSTLSTGYNIPEGLAMDGSGNLFVADYLHNQVKEVLAAGGYTTINTLGSGISSPTAVAVDGSGNVFVVDYNNHAVKELLAAGGYTTVLTLSSNFSSPFGLALDGSGNVFVADYGAHAVKELLAAGGYTTMLTLSSSFSAPRGIAVDGGGNVFVADSNAVKELVAQGGYTTVNTLSSAFSTVFSVALDANSNIYVADFGSAVVKKMLAAGGYTTVNSLGSGLGSMRGVFVDSKGNVYVSNAGNAIVKLNYADPPALTFASTQVGATSSDSPKTVTLVNSGNATLTLPPPTTGLNPSISNGFTFGNTSTCPQLSASSSSATLAAGASCTNLISFSPTTSGSIGGSLVITDNALNTPGPGYTTQSIALSGTATGTVPTIVFTVANHTFGDALFTVSASSNSTGAFAYSVVSGPATISGATVTLTGAGTVVLQAAEAPDSNYLAGTQSTTFTVAAATPAITFAVPTHTYGDASFTVSATSNSSGAFTYSVVSGPATMAGSTVTLTGTGTVVLSASEAASGSYTSGTLNATFTVVAATPTLAFTIPGHTYGDAPFTIAATSNSTGAITYTVLSGPVTIAGSTVTLTGAGTVVMQASVAADSNYSATTQNATFSVAAGTPTLAFTVPGHTYGDAPFTVGASSNSSGAITYTVLSGPATVAGSTVTLTGTGTVVLQAAQAASANYVAGSTSATFAVVAGTPTIVFTVPNHTYGDAPFTVSATSNSSGAITYTVLSGPATVSGSTVTINGTGTVALQASQAASANYIAATSVVTFVVAAANPTIVFTVPNHTYGDAPFTVSATSNSTGAFTYIVLSGPATIAGSTLTLTGAGTVVLQGSQAATSNYVAASATATFAVVANTPMITFAVPSHTYGDAPFTVSAASNSSGAFTYIVLSGPATVSGATVTLTGAGTVSLQVSQAANANYAAASSVATFAVAPGNPTLTFAVPTHIYGDAPFTVSASSNSTAAFTYAVVSGPATLSGATITLTSAGLVTLRASQAANANYTAASVTTTFLVTASIALTPDSPTVSTQTIPAGTSAGFKLAFTPGGGTYLNPLQLSVSGLPVGATATFFPAIIPAGSPATSIVLVVQTTAQTARNDQPSTTLPTLALALLLMPLLGLKSIRKRLRSLPTLALLAFSLAATFGLSGCGTTTNTSPGKSYPLAVTATDTVTGVRTSTNVTLVVQ